MGIENPIVDSSRIEVNRKARRAKTERLAVGKLLTMRMRYQHGEQRAWSVVNVPSPQVEERRHLHRELNALIAERTQHPNRIKGLLVTQGLCRSVTADFLPDLEPLQLWAGSPWLPGLGTRLRREFQGYLLVQAQIKALEQERLDLVRSSDRADIAMVCPLMRLRGIGICSAWMFVAWRNFRNGRQIGAWGWLHPQPESQLSHWFQQRFGQGSQRLRKIGIMVAGFSKEKPIVRWGTHQRLLNRHQAKTELGV
jgi:transposase